MAFRNPIIRVSELVGDLLVGATIVIGQLADAGNRIVMRTDAGDGIMEFFTGTVREAAPGILRMNDSSGVGDSPELHLYSPTDFNPDLTLRGHLHLSGTSDDGTELPLAVLEALSGTAALIGTSISLSALTIVVGGTLDLNAHDITDIGSLQGLGRTISRLDFGTFTGNTNASGDVSVAHNLGVVPTVVIMQENQGMANRRVRHVAASDTNAVFVGRVMDAAGVVVGAGIGASFDWWALSA